MFSFPSSLLSICALSFSIFTFVSPAYASFSCDVGKPSKNRVYDDSPYRNPSGERVIAWVIPVKNPRSVVLKKTLINLLSSKRLESLTPAVYHWDQEWPNLGGGKTYPSHNGIYIAKNPQGKLINVVFSDNEYSNEGISCINYSTNMVTLYEPTNRVYNRDTHAPTQLPVIGIRKITGRLVYTEKYGSF